MVAPQADSNAWKSRSSTLRSGGSSWILRSSTWVVSALTLVALAATGCADATDGRDDVPVASATVPGAATQIYGGQKDIGDAAEDAVVALRVGKPGAYELCTGALIAPNVVLTARHCVSRNATTSVSCDAEGGSSNGPHVLGDEAPGDVAVFVGSAPRFGALPSARARAIVAPETDYLCNADIALVVLDAPLDDVEPLAVRLRSRARPGERVRAIGYGHNDTDLPLGTRFRKADVEVLARGKGVSSSNTALGSHEFEVGRSICKGDSGGPAISEETGAIIGVVSRGGGCDDDFGHIYTSTAGFSSLFDRAFALAGGAPVLEPGDVADGSLDAEFRSNDESFGGFGGPRQSGCAQGGRPSSGGGGGGMLVACAAIVCAASRRRQRRS